MERDELYRLVDIILNHADRDELEVIRAALERRDEDAEAREGYGGLEVSPKQLAEGTARSIAEQMSYSRDTLRNMIKNFAVDIIRKEAPELSDAQVRELLHAWIPDPEGRTPPGDRSGGTGSRSRGGAGSQGPGGLVDAGGRGGRSQRREQGLHGPPGFTATGSAQSASIERDSGLDQQTAHDPDGGVDPESGLPKDLLVTMIEQFISYSEGRMGVREQAKLRREIPDWQEVYWKRFPPGIRDSLSLYLKGTIDHEDFWLDIHTRLGL